MPFSSGRSPRLHQPWDCELLVHMRSSQKSVICWSRMTMGLQVFDLRIPSLEAGLMGFIDHIAPEKPSLFSAAKSPHCINDMQSFCGVIFCQRGLHLVCLQALLNDGKRRQRGNDLFFANPFA